MPIAFVPFQHADQFHGNMWIVNDESLLAQQIATIALGQSRHVQKILAGANLASPPTTLESATAAINLLTVAGETPWQRDGWLFQAISWIAANKKSPGNITRAPQMILADKGFDGVQLELDQNTKKVVAVIICEDKATDNQLKMIQKVWPEFQKLEAGERENVLTAEVVALLESQPGIDPDSAIENIIWKQARHYRVSITVGDEHATESGRIELFQDYETVVVGPLKRRQADTIHVPSLRDWMQSLAEQSISAIQAKVADNV